MKVTLNPAYKKLGSFVNLIPERFNEEGTSIYKARNEIKVFEIDGLQLNVKRYKVPHFINRIIYTLFRPTKASRAYKYGLKLMGKRFDTPAPIAYIITKKRGLIHYTYFISFQCSYPRRMYEFGEDSWKDRIHILRSFVHYTARLHKAGVYHKDYSPGNILFEEIGSEVKFCLIDINRMEFKPVSVKKGCKNFARLWGNESMFRFMAKEYAIERNADVNKCTKWILYYRNLFWHKYSKKHDVPFSL